MPSFRSARERPAGSGAPRFADSTPAASAEGAPEDEVADRDSGTEQRGSAGSTLPAPGTANDRKA